MTRLYSERLTSATAAVAHLPAVAHSREQAREQPKRGDVDDDHTDDQKYANRYRDCIHRRHLSVEATFRNPRECPSDHPAR